MPTLNVDQLMPDSKAFKEGPMDLLWGQDEWIPPRDDFVWPDLVPADWRRRRPLDLLLRRRRWIAAVRVTPPEGVDLGEWGTALAGHFDLPSIAPKPEDRSVFFVLTVWARNAGDALGSTGRFFKMLPERTLVRTAAIRVWKAV